jgi:hypothetical protein
MGNTAIAQTKELTVEKSLMFLDNLEKNDFEANAYLMAPGYIDGKYSQKLASSWNYQLGELGAYVSLKSVKYDKFKDYDLVYLTCAFEKSDYTIKLMFNKRKEITDIYFIPYPPIIPIGKLNTIWVLIFLVLWELAWKALGLWKAASNKQLGWFLVIFILATVGIIPIIYVLFINPKKRQVPQV